MTLLDEVSAIRWLEPWAALEASAARDRERALAGNLVTEHPLYGRKARALGARTDDTDDVLFWVDAPEELCVVNLGGSRRRSKDCPFFVGYASLEEFEQGCMLPDHQEYSDEDV